MRFAISLLSFLAVASVAGTILKQGEPYNNYLNQNWPTWLRAHKQQLGAPLVRLAPGLKLATAAA